jgi:hypothetical protein
MVREHVVFGQNRRKLKQFWTFPHLSLTKHKLAGQFPQWEKMILKAFWAIADSFQYLKNKKIVFETIFALRELKQSIYGAD